METSSQPQWFGSVSHKHTVNNFSVFWASQLSPLPICLQDVPRLTNQKWLVVEHCWTLLKHPPQAPQPKYQLIGINQSIPCSQGKSPHSLMLGTPLAGQRSYRHLQVNSKRSHLAALWSATSPIRQQLSCRKPPLSSLSETIPSWLASWYRVMVPSGNLT